MWLLVCCAVLPHGCFMPSHALCPCAVFQAEAKDAFKELLAAVNTGSDWTWEQTMRLIVNDGRCGGDV